MQRAAKALAELAPEGLGPEGPGWQQRKSSQTRVAILDATVACLAEHGYVKTTTQQIALMADISRGAMLHHYATKQDLITAVIDYVFYKRMEVYAERMRTLTEQQRVTEGRGVEITWEVYSTPEYRAFMELRIASRNDPDLHAIFLPKAQRYDRIWRDETARVFPEWAGDPERLDLAIDYVTGLLEGLHLNAEIWQNPERDARVRAFMAQQLILLREGRLSFPPPLPPQPASRG